MSVVGAALRGFGRALRRKGKVSPTIKSVKPNLKKTVQETKSDEYRRRYQALDKSEAKLKKGREMMREGQKERRHMVDTGRAFQFRYGKSYHAIKPGDKDKYTSQMRKQISQPKFKKGKELDREPKAAGGLMRAARKLKEMQDRRRRMGEKRKAGPGGMSPGKPRPKSKPSPRKPRPKTYPPKRVMTPLAKGGRSFPDLSGDGKVTRKDILMGRGVIKKRRSEEPMRDRMKQPLKKND